MNKKISTIYNSNYDQKKTIRNSFLNDYLLPKQLVICFIFSMLMIFFRKFINLSKIQTQ